MSPDPVGGRHNCPTKLGFVQQKLAVCQTAVLQLKKDFMKTEQVETTIMALAIYVQFKFEMIYTKSATEFLIFGYIPTFKFTQLLFPDSWIEFEHISI